MKHRNFAMLLVGTAFMTLNAFQSQAAGDPHVVRATLKNGLRVVVVRDALAPVVSTVMNYLVGADEEDITGLAHASEHMMFRGSKSVSASVFANVTALTGGSFNAETQNEITQFFFTMPSQDLDIALRLEASRARDLLDTQALWDQERLAITQEVTSDNSDAEYRLYVKVLHHLLAGTPYADEGLGTVETFARQVNAPQLQRFYHTWYHPNNALLVVAGDVDPTAAIAKVERYFGTIPARPLPARKAAHLGPLKPATFRDESDKSYAMAMTGYRYPGYQDPLYAASQVLVDVLNSQRADLYALVANGQALSCSFESQGYPRAGLAVASIAVPAGGDTKAAAQLLQGVIQHYRASGVPPELVEAAKLRETAAAEYKGNSIEGLAFDWANALAVERRNSPDDDIVAIQKVTADDVNRVLRQYLVPETATVAFSIPNNSGGVSSSGGRAGEDNTIIPTEHKPLPSWAAAILKHLHVPRQTTQPVSMTLSNGIHLIVQPESITHTIVLRGHIQHNPDLQEAPGTEGVASITDNLLPFGTATWDRLGYQAELDKIAANVETGTGFSLSVLSKDFDRGVQLLADDELHPAFNDKDFAIIKQQAVDEVVGNEHAPEHLASVARTRALYPHQDPSQRFATPASVRGLTLGAVKAWYARIYRPDMTTIVIIGDVTPEVARTTVEKWFGEWRASGPKPDTDLPAVPDNPPATVVIPAQGRIQDQVELVETLGLTRKDPDFAPLMVADTVLSGGFYASLLFHDLREIHGYVYSVSSRVALAKIRSTFSIDYGAMPDKVNLACSAALRELQALQQTPLPVERVLKAKALLMGGIPTEEQSYDGLAGRLLYYAINDLSLNQGRLDAQAELAVTPEQLRNAVKKWIRPDGFVRIIQGPAPR
ncbi:MAG TPA: pitrilysin family protein [Candidatus Xenobia bacterium]|jgi:zinc protease